MVERLELAVDEGDLLARDGPDEWLLVTSIAYMWWLHVSHRARAVAWKCMAINSWCDGFDGCVRLAPVGSGGNRLA
jgi:hypothetical protein